MNEESNSNEAALTQAGVLYSRIGYQKGASKRVVARGPAGYWRDGAVCLLRAEAGEEVARSTLIYWGEQWGTHWWVADFSDYDHVGRYQARLIGEERSVESGVFEIGEDQLFRATWRSVSFEQAERRQRFATDRSGWFDAGMHWQEANSHAAYLIGLCDLMEFRGEALEGEAVERLVAQIRNGVEYLGRLQDLATEHGLSDGGLAHQSFKFDKVVLTADASKAFAAWARALRVLPLRGEEKEALRVRIERLRGWLRKPKPTPEPDFNPAAYGLPEDYAMPDGEASTDLMMRLDGEVSLSQEHPTKEARAVAEALLDRQVLEGEGEDDYYGMFRQYPGEPFTVKAWTHGMLPQKVPMPVDLGNTLGLNLFPLIRLLEAYPNHGDSGKWREGLRRFAYGYFAPACRKNPFLLCPNGHFEREGPIWFAGLWHGANAIYGMAAGLAKDFSRLFGDPSFLEIAEGNLQWIAGVNCGLTREHLQSCLIFDREVGEHEAIPVSMINGIGTQTAGTWLNIRGAICNGFGVGDQFKWDVPPKRKYDCPNRLTDEDWITHAGGWLMGISRK